MDNLNKMADNCYRNQIKRCYNKKANGYHNYGGKGIKVVYTKKEFIEWYLKNVSNWIKNNQNKRVSVGRIDHSKDYSFENIKIESLADNVKECHKRNGNPAIKRQKIVEIYDTNYNLIYEAKGTRDAAKYTGISQGNLANILKKGNLKSGKFIIKYTNQVFKFRKYKEYTKYVAIEKESGKIAFIGQQKEMCEFTGMVDRTLSMQAKGIFKPRWNKHKYIIKYLKDVKNDSFTT